VHRPSNLDPNEAVPLLFVAHGYTMTGAQMRDITGFNSIADAEGFVVVYPNGQYGGPLGGPWQVSPPGPPNVCAPGDAVDNNVADTFAYFEAMRAAIEDDQCIHPDQVFVTGFSMGGYLSNHIGCQLGNTFVRAVGPHSGGTYVTNDCPGAPLPVFIMHGATDTFIHWDTCGGGARDQWIQRNGCDDQFDRESFTGGHCDWYRGCDPDGQTVYCLFDGVGHSWANGASQRVWDFFKATL
jgi:poly(3-hydroxybutyrate) depolymerase